MTRKLKRLELTLKQWQNIERGTDQKASLGDKIDKLENIGERQHIPGQCFSDIFFPIIHLKKCVSHQENPPSLMPAHTQMLTLQKCYKILLTFTMYNANIF